MSTTTKKFGIFLILLALVTYSATGFVHTTALIPAIFGVLFVVLGSLAERENLRKHMMHAAALIAILGIGVNVSALPKMLIFITGGEVDRSYVSHAERIGQEGPAGILFFLTLGLRRILRELASRNVPHLEEGPLAIPGDVNLQFERQVLRINRRQEQKPQEQT